MAYALMYLEPFLLTENSGTKLIYDLVEAQEAGTAKLEIILMPDAAARKIISVGLVKLGGKMKTGESKIPHGTSHPLG
jgi:Xaa-Pro aminopeptidase